MSYVELGILLLRVVSSFLDWAKGQQQFSAGQDAEIAKTALAVLKQTELGKRIVEKIDAMSPAERDEFTDALGRAGEG